MLSPTYTKKVPRYDGWGVLFQVATGNAETYAVKSYGANETFPNITATTSTGPITTNSFDCDIVFSEGNFVVYPDGVPGSESSSHPRTSVRTKRAPRGARFCFQPMCFSRSAAVIPA